MVATRAANTISIHLAAPRVTVTNAQEIKAAHHGLENNTIRRDASPP